MSIAREKRNGTAVCLAVLLAAGVFAVSAGSASAEDMKISAEADNWINRCSGPAGEYLEPHHLANHGSDTSLQIRRWFGAGCKDEAKAKRVLLQFSLAALPEGITAEDVTEAEIGLYYYWKSAGPGLSVDGRRVDLHRLTNSWEELTSNWSYRDMTETCPDPNLGPDVEHYNTGDRWDSCQDAPYVSYNNDTSNNLCEVPESYYGPTPYDENLGGGDYDHVADAVSYIPASFGWMTWDVTDLVKEWLGGTDNCGVLIKDYDESWDPFASDAGDAYKYRFHSREYSADPTLQPYLNITYVPEPATIGLLAAGGLLTILRRRRRVV
jgi:hypothetical protein